MILQLHSDTCFEYCGLTEVDNDVFVFVDEVLENFIGDFLDSCGVLLLDEPLENLVFVEKIAFVKCWNFVFEIDQCWKMIDSVLLGFGIIVYTDDYDALFFQLVIDVLQFIQNSNILFVVFVVCVNEKFLINSR